VNDAKRLDWRHWLADVRRWPAPTDGAIAVALLLLPWVIALALELLHHLSDTAVAVLASASFGLPVAWLAWIPVRNANRSGTAGLAPPARVVRVSEADPRLLGVHAAIRVPGVPDEVLPEYVLRDVDDAELGVRASVAAAAERGGFVLLVGASSVGKTRCAVEAVKVWLPDWWLVRPAAPDQVAALAHRPPRRTVVWLDELQRYFDGEQGLTDGVLEALLSAPHPVVIIGTLWPDLYAAYAALPEPGGADPHARQRHVLGQATAVVHIDAAFSAAEQDRARAAATRDPRLQIALDTAGYGLTQTLAAAPQLVDHWKDAKTADPYAWGVLTAALDVTLLGARAPLSADFLRAAAPDYYTSRQQAEAPKNWFEQALDYATRKLLGAVAALTPVPAGMGEVAGYTAADYLIQHVSRKRRYEHVPASTWDAALRYIDDPGDTVRLADSARDRLLYRYAIPLYQHATDAGDRFAATRLADLLAKRGDLDDAEQTLRGPADAGDRYAAEKLADLLAKRGDLDQAEQILRDLDSDGYFFAGSNLDGLLYRRGDLDGLRARASAGDRYAAEKLADLLAERDDLDGLRARADAGDTYAAIKRAGLMAKRGEPDHAEQILRGLADAGDRTAAEQLAELLYERGNLDGAIQILRDLDDANGLLAAPKLASLMYERGDLDGMRALAEAGEQYAVNHLANLLAERGDLDELRARADAAGGDSYTAIKLAGLLAERGDLDELRARANAGDRFAASRLLGLLINQGRGQEAERLRQFGFNPDGSIGEA
jgi:hypothetical protein